MLKNYAFISTLLLFVFISFFGSTVYAEDTLQVGQETTLANINIYQPAIISEEKGKVRIGFDIANGADTAQPDIRYGIEIVQTTESGQTIVDSVVADEVLALRVSDSVHREIEYIIPPYLSGKYDIWVVSRTTSGMMLGIGRAGFTTFTNTAPYIAIVPDSCALTVSGETKSFTLYQGVDVASSEVLSLACTLESHFKSDVTVTPSFATYRRSTFGELVDTVPQTSASITLKAGEKKQVTFAIPKASIAQAYDVRVALMDARQNMVSNEVIAHYVLRGASATIQTAFLDKTSYALGDTLTARINWTPSADSFFDSRAGEGTPLSNTILTFSVTDDRGVLCVEPTTRTLTSTEQSFTLSAPVKAFCAEPKMLISLSDDKGNILDNRTYESPKADTVYSNEAVNQETEKKGYWTIEMFIVLITTVSSLMILYVLMSIRAIMRGDVILKSLILAFLVTASCMVGTGEAHALTFNTSFPYDEVAMDNDINDDNLLQDNLVLAAASYTVNTDKSEYTPGETVNLSATGHGHVCENTSPFISVSAAWEGIDWNSASKGSYVDLIELQDAGYQRGILYGYNTLTAPTTPGTYTIDVNACYQGWVSGCVVKKIQVTVVSPSADTNPDIVLGKDILNDPSGVFGGASCDIGGYAVVDGMNVRSVFSGWACDPSDFSQALTIEFYEGSNLLGTTRADIDKGDLAISNMCGGNTAHRFVFDIPESLITGTDKSITVIAKNSQSGADTILSGSGVMNCPVPPDLYAVSDSPSATDNVFLKGSAITFKGRAVNTDTADIPQGYWAGIEIGTPDSYDYFAIPNSSTQLGSFAKGQSKDLLYSESNLPAGTYSYRFNVDSVNNLHETNESNNRSAWTSFSVVDIDGDLTASESVDSGTSADLVWDTTNISGSSLGCKVQGGGESWPVTGDGGAKTKALTTETLYTLVCGSTLLDSATVKINGTASQGVIDLSATRILVNQNENTTLLWDTDIDDEKTCTLGGGSMTTNPLLTDGGDPYTGSFDISVNARTVYTLTCPHGSDTVTVEVVPISYGS